jgi:AraC-like DNA-binding protein
LAKIAEVVDRHSGADPGSAGTLRTHWLAGSGAWTVEQVTCTSGPTDPSFEERHSCFRVAIVVAGTFYCRSAQGRELFTPGSLLLGNAGETFECGHEHGSGDRCLSFGYAPDYFDRLACDAGACGTPRLRALRVPPLRELAPVIARACTEQARADGAWEELAVLLAVRALRVSGAVTAAPRSAPNAERAVTHAVRLIDRDPSATLTLEGLAREAALSRYHFLRTFAKLTGLTPHQYLRRARLRNAAVRLASDDVPVIDVALGCGFPDVSNFNRAFRAEFGINPRTMRVRSSSRETFATQDVGNPR